jgi:hypothetical protein
MGEMPLGRSRAGKGDPLAGLFDGTKLNAAVSELFHK